MALNKQLDFAIALLAGFLVTPAGALEILLTNDDGYEAEGINIMFDELVAAGHNVTMVAPWQNNSGGGMSISVDPFKPVDVAEVEPDKWYVAGTPVDCVQFGLDVLFTASPPDLVVSGSNHGFNPGVSIGMSGTVGAAQNAILRGVPAIAVSVGENQRDQEGILRAMDDAARFTAQVIDRITVAGNDIALPDGIGLNINYPGRDAEDIEGVAVTRLSSYARNPFTFRKNDDGIIVSVIDPPRGEATEQQEREDWHMIFKGYVTVTPLDPNLNAAALNQARVEQLLGDKLEP
ncbi:MAG: 5'/3'-nucleotidase SurE [Gammaproteobacteria bacterium]|jgi:5'-nucleotidase|nr:5'/3'-nucleotidase SurE [Gammaproteobacteria bacterium]MDP6617793.1 5'/3'-nucleotidase SurE [Gammaproteobacteria bacterium]MDP6694179.1 5'/3'-nucleotidase SurE [Gammaproteobacteria bacterium]